MTIQQDLSGSRWVLNEKITSTGFTLDADFVSNNIYWGGFTVNASSVRYYVVSQTEVWTENGGWVNEAYRTIVFDDDTANATDATLISWLIQNAQYISGGTGFYASLDDFFESVADAIRTANGTADLIPPYAFPAEISGGGGGSISSATATGDGTTAISFAVDGEPKLMAIQISTPFTESDLPSSSYIIVDGQWPVGTNSQFAYNGMYKNNGVPMVSYSMLDAGAVAYASGTVTITTSSAIWFNGKTYKLLYVY